MTGLVQDAVNALAAGSTYALLALGLAAVFNILRMINFAHGELLTIGGFTLYLLAQADMPLGVMLVGAIVVPALAAMLMERIAFRPVRGASLTTTLLTSFAVSIVVQNVLLIAFDARPKAVPFPSWFNENVSLGSIDIQVIQILSTASTAAALLALLLFLRRTSLGVSMRAAADDFEVTRLMGVRANGVIAAAFAISGALAGLASILWVARRGTVDPSMGLTPVVLAFIAVVIGGLGNLGGAVAGGFLLGAIQVALESTLSSDALRYIDAFTLSLVVLVLVVRPRGLFGQDLERA